MTPDAKAKLENLCNNDARKSYAPPFLKQFGPVSALTQAGTAGRPEMMAGVNMNWMA